MKKLIMCFLTLVFTINLGADASKDFYFRGTFYQDWMGLKSEGLELYNRLSSRLKLTFLNRPGDGWTAYIDVRNRFTPGDKGKNQLIIYDARISYEGRKSGFFCSLGQMNLYDTAGIGLLTGAVIGLKLGKNVSLGGYGGLEPDVYNTQWDTDYNKFGVFIRFRGSGARRFSLSFNRIGFNNETERQFIYSSLLFPIRRVLVLYGNLEYELHNRVKKEDRLSRVFLNARIDISRYADITANFSSGRGLDYHRFLLEQSQDPTIQNSELERFYYNQTYGVRLSIKPTKKIRIFAARRQSESKDRAIENNTTRLGLSLADLLGTRISLYGSYNINRGDFSESDSYYISASRSFGKLYGSLSFANYYNGVRISVEGTPELFHIPDCQTLSANLYLTLHRSLALALEYAFSYREDDSDHQFFVRLIFRK